MKIDLSVNVNSALLKKISGSLAQVDLDLEKQGHVGTHFDVMDKAFSIENVVTKGRVFDISHIQAEKVDVKDLDLSKVEKHDFIMFHSGILKRVGYGEKEYFAANIEIANGLVDCLIEKGVSFIGVDMNGAQKPKNHLYIDQYCADRGVFIIENLNNLDVVLERAGDQPFTVYTFPVNMSGFSGLPCRVIAEI